MTSSGCATLWTVFEVTGVDWRQGEIQKTTPLGPEEKRLQVQGEYVAPPPVIAQAVEAPPPMPGVVVVEPQPEPVGGRPFPQGSLRFTCEEQARVTRERVDETYFRYDGVWKALTAFMFISEAAIASLLIWASTNEPGKIDGVPLGVGIGFGLDAIGTAILFWHGPEERKKSWEQDGQWKVKSRECTSPLSVAVSTGAFPVEKDGTVPGLGEWMLQHVVDTEDSALEFQLGSTVVPWRPEVLEKCEWAKQAQSPAPFCRWASGWRAPTVATIPLP